MSDPKIEDKYWSCTTALRWLNREEIVEQKFGPATMDIAQTVKVLQQQWMSDKGNFEWRDVPTVNEGE